MSTIQVTDTASVLFNVQPDPLSSIMEYAPKLDHVALKAPAFVQLLEKPVDQIPKDASIETGISVGQPVAVAAKNLKLTINAEVSGSLGCIRPDPHMAGTPLLESDPIAEGITFERKQCYMTLALNASVSAVLTDLSGKLNFGIEPGTGAAFTCYQRFEPIPGKTLFKDLVAQSIAGFTIPAAVEDLQSMAAGSVATVDYSGSLKLSAVADLLPALNPLASLELPAGFGTLGVKAGESITVSASFEVAGGHQIRVHKSGPNQVTIGYYRKTGSTEQFSVTASAGVTAEMGTFELFSLVLRKISPDAKADQERLEKAGLSQKQIAAIKGAVKAGIDRKLQASLSEELSLLSSREAAFLYRVDLGKLADNGKRALASALHGDLTHFGEDGSPLPAGITRVKSVFAQVRQRTNVFKINLLGILNAFTISDLVAQGRIVVDDDKGEVTILDQVSASRIKGLAENFRLNDEGRRKLRRLLAESFLITAAYTAAGAAAGPELKASHSFFKLSQNANRHQMQDHVTLARTLSLSVPKDVDHLIGTVDEFGQATAEAETSYGAALTPLLFLYSNQQARDVDEFERIGLDALLALVHQGDADDWRRIPGEHPSVFRDMKKIGNVASKNFRDLFPRLDAEVQVPVIGADYLTIRWWADSMHQLGVRLKEIKVFLADPNNKNIDLKTNPHFAKLRRKLADQVKHVAHNAREEFGAPWGLVAMYLASGRKAASSMRIANAKLPGGLYEGHRDEQGAVVGRRGAAAVAAK